MTCSENNDGKVKALFSLFDKNLKEQKRALSLANETINKDESTKTMDNAVCTEYHKWSGNNNSCEAKIENATEILSCISKCLENLKIPKLEEPKMFDDKWWLEISSRLVIQFTLLI